MNVRKTQIHVISIVRTPMALLYVAVMMGGSSILMDVLVLVRCIIIEYHFILADIWNFLKVHGHHSDPESIVLKDIKPSRMTVDSSFCTSIHKYTETK